MDPQIHADLERYVAGRYYAILHDDTFWNSAMMQQGMMLEWRRYAADLAKRYPSVSAEELAALEVWLAPEIKRQEQYMGSRPKGLDQAAAVIVATLAWLSLACTIICGMVSSLIVPGGVVMHLLGFAVVDHDGRQIGRARSLLRLILAFLPGIVWLAWLATTPRIQGWVPAPASPLLAAGISLGLLAAGAIVSLSQPTRGPHDRILGTTIVPR